MSGAELEITADAVAERVSRMVIEEEAAATPGELAYRKAAAVLASFVPDQLKPVGSPRDAESLAALMRLCEPVYTADGRLEWRLPDAVRRETLESFSGDKEVQEAAARGATASSPAQRMLSAYLTLSAPPLGAQSYEELLATAQVTPWLQGIVGALPDLEDVKHRLAVAELLAPMRRLVGSWFQGRADVLGRLHDYTDILPWGSRLKTIRRRLRQASSLLDNPPLVLYGPGGVGKSTVLAKFILDHSDSEDRIPFVYIDFDRPGMLPQEPLTLLVEALRQLGAQYPAIGGRAEELRSTWLQRLSQPNFALLASAVIDPLAQLAEGSSDLPETMKLRASVPARMPFYEEFAGIVDEIFRRERARQGITEETPGGEPLLFVLDTFEMVQYYGADVVREVWEFLDGLQRQLPSLRVVIAGRAPMDEYSTRAVRLAGFDDDSARGFLSSLLGAELAADSELVEHIVRVVGHNPLSLRLAADLAVHYEAAKLRDPNSRRELFVGVKKAKIQGWLYNRILDRITDPAVRALAHPGLVVRRLTPDVIRYVLAGPCGVDVPDDIRARELFDACAREVSLLSWNPDGSLSHRADIRREMLPLLREDEPGQVDDIHSAAVSYYAQYTDMLARAEELYHRLCLRDTADALDQRWQPGVQNYLAMSLEELPAEGQVYLASRLGVTLPPDVVSRARAREQEQYMVARVRQLIQLGDLDTALNVLSEQEEPAYDSPLNLLQAQVLEGLGRLDEASRVLDRASQKAADAADGNSLLELQYAAARLAERQGGTVRALELLAAARATTPEPLDPIMPVRLWSAEFRLWQSRLGELTPRLLELSAQLKELTGKQHPVSSESLAEADRLREEADSLQASVAQCQARISAALGELLRLVDAASQEDLTKDPALLVELASEIGEQRPGVLRQALSSLGLQNLASSQAEGLATALAAWDSSNDRLPASELLLPGGPRDRTAVWAEWLGSNPTKAAWQTLADLLDRYPGGQPVITVISGIYREPLSTSRAGDWAICCSGGSTGSMAYCLGALQGLDEAGLLAKARWILGVSRGSYIGAARALAAEDLPAGTQPPAYAPGTPEESSLRNETRYVVPDAATGLLGALSLVFGALARFVIVLAPVYAFAHAWGWLLRWQGILVPAGPNALTSAVTGLGWWLPVVIAAGVMLLLFLFWRLSLGPAGYRRRRLATAWWDWLAPDRRGSGAVSLRLVNSAAVVTAGLALAMLAAPPLISWLVRSSAVLSSMARPALFGSQPAWSLPALAGLVTVVAAIAQFCQAGLARWNAPTAAGLQPGVLGMMAGWLRQQVLPWLASAVIVLVGALLALLWAGNGARAGFGAGQIAVAAAALAVMLLARVAVNVNRLSMHDFYRWRLASAFAVTRRAAQEWNPARARGLFASAAATRLSDLRGSSADEPSLVICCTANISPTRQVPPSRGSFCLAFDPEHVSLHREQDLSASESTEAVTSDYEALVGTSTCTLFDLCAISGAGVSPLMSTATRQAYRILLTAASVRPGVWLPHPALVREARRRIEQQAAGMPEPPDRWWTRRPLFLLLWYLSPHPFWDRDGHANSDREARLWAHVLMLRLRGRRSGALWYRTMQPTLGLLWSEAVGRSSYRATWMYVTDGSRYDALGLVEALRRGARHIVVLDASGDRADTWFTLGASMALARSDAGADIALDPTTMVRGGTGLAPGQVIRPWAYGTFTRTERMLGLTGQGDIWVCKPGCWSGAPWDVLAYAKAHPSYPTDSTREQLYDAAEFEAYRELGAVTVLAAAEQGTPPLKPAIPAARRIEVEAATAVTSSHGPPEEAGVT
jgi:cellulose synthase operon protein C